MHMRIRRAMVLGALGLIAVLVALAVFAVPASAAECDGLELPSGCLFTATGGDTEDPNDGFAVIDSGGVPLWEFFRTLDLQKVGYPISQRWTEGTFVYQAFQKVILQWDEAGQRFNYLNTLDILFNDYGLNLENVPEHRILTEDVGASFDRIVENHLAILDDNPEIRTAFLAEADWLSLYGLPIAYEEREVMGNPQGLQLLRTQRAVFEIWNVQAPGTESGAVGFQNVPDKVKQLDDVIIPESAKSPVAAGQITSQAQTWDFDRVRGPLTLNTTGRGLFANVLLRDDTVYVTYQTAAADSLTGGKNLYFRMFDRELNALTNEAVGIDVYSTAYMDWQGDLGDHKLVLESDRIYVVAIVKGDPRPAVLSFGLDFEYLAGPTYLDLPAGTTERYSDMGFGSDGDSLYAQFFNQPAGSLPEQWGASIYRINQGLVQEDHAVVYPEQGSFVTGTSIVFVPRGQMGAGMDRLQIFSTNRDFGNQQRVGIHTFAADTDLALIPGSTRDLIVADLDIYFPTGPSWNERHQLWVLGYTMENFEGDHGGPTSRELGPSFLSIFDAEWGLIETIPLNEGDPAFRVMTQTEGDDIYVVYDEMDKQGSVTSSRARIEHYRIAGS